MKKNMKRLLCMGLAAGMALGSTAVSMAGTWKQGAAPNENRWWYDFDNGGYAAGGWLWIDGNNDGVSEYYYFDPEGWMLADTMTPDGNMVNADGAWVMNGVVQTQTAQLPVQQAAQSLCWMWEIGADGTYVENTQLISADIQDWYNSYTTFYQAHQEDYANGIYDFSTEERIAFWAQTSDRGAAWKQVFDRYGIVSEMLKDISDRKSSTYTLTTAPGMTEDDARCICSAVSMMTAICTDGMAEYTWDGSIDDDGTVTVTIQVQLFFG